MLHRTLGMLLTLEEGPAEDGTVLKFTGPLAPASCCNVKWTQSILHHHENAKDLSGCLTRTQVT